MPEEMAMCSITHVTLTNLLSETTLQSRLSSDQKTGSDTGKISSTGNEYMNKINNRNIATTSHGSSRKLINEWSCLVASMEQGYKFTIYDYTNDLSVRGAIQAILSSGFKLPQELYAQLNVADEKFKRCVEWVTYPLIKNAVAAEFWYYGIPLNATAEMITDARNLAPQATAPQPENRTGSRATSSTGVHQIHVHS